MKQSEQRQQLRQMSSPELEARMADLYQEIFNLRFQAATRQLENNQRAGQVRREIARIKTLLRERELAEVS